MERSDSDNEISEEELDQNDEKTLKSYYK